MGSTVQSGGATILDAEHGISIEAATNRYSESHSSDSKTISTGTATASLGDLGRAMSGGHNSSGVQLLPHNRQASTAQGQSVATWQTASTVTGQTVTVNSRAGNIHVGGSNVAAQETVAIVAPQGSVQIESGTQTQTSTESYHQGTLGNVGRTSTSATAGYSKQRGSQEEIHQTQSVAASQITSSTGDVAIGACEQVRVTSSQITAGGNVGISAKQIAIDAGLDEAFTQAKHENQQIGVTFSVNNPVVSAVQTAHDMQQAAKASDNARLQALAATAAALAAANRYYAVAQNPASAGGISANVDLGVSHGRHRQGSQSATSSRSAVQSGGDTTFKASGAGSASNITVKGSTITAAHNVTLQADGSVLLEATKNTHQRDSDRSSGSASVGVGFAVGGTQNGFTLNFGASSAHGKTQGNSTTWNHTQVQAGGVAALQSGEDTTLKGAVVSGNQVVAHIGGNLAIQSVQDITEYASKDHGGGVGVSLCIPPFCYGMSSVSGHADNRQLDSQYASVTQQSGLKAGDGGFQVRVGKNTDLVAGVMSSSDLAVALGLNRLDTRTLTTRDMENKASYSGEQIALGGGYSFGDAASGGDARGDGGGNATTGDAKTGENASGQSNSAVGLDQKGNAASGTHAVPGTTLPGYKGISASVPIALEANGDAHSTTHSAFSAGAITIRDWDGQLALTGQTPEQTIAELNRDTSNTLNSLDPIFDKKKIEAGFEIVSTLKQESGTFFINKAKEAEAKAAALREQAKNPNLTRDQRAEFLAQADEIVNAWGPGGTYRRVISAGLAAAGGNVTGGGTEQFVQAAAVNYLQGLGAKGVKAISDQLDRVAGEEVTSARAALHAIVGCAGAAASNQACSAGALGAGAGTVVNALMGIDPSKMTAQEKEAWSNTLGSVVGGIASMNGVQAATATTASITETDNNQLEALMAGRALGAALGLANGSPRYPLGHPQTQEERLLGINNPSSGGLNLHSQSMSDELRVHGLTIPGLDKYQGDKDGFLPNPQDTSSSLPLPGRANDPVAAPAIPGYEDIGPQEITQIVTPNNGPAPVDPILNTQGSGGSGPFWSSAGHKTGVANAYGHWDKHRYEFPEYQNSVQYVQGAQDFVSNPPAGTLIKTRPNGDILLYNPSTNTFAVKTVNGAPRTMFRPSGGMSYWNKQ